MEVNQLILYFSWAFAFCCLVIFMTINYVVYLRNRDKVFFWYAIYSFCVLIYVFTKNRLLGDGFNDLLETPLMKSFNWYIQILYYNAYFVFSIKFLDLDMHHPKIVKYIYRYQKIIIGFSSFLFLLNVIGVLHYMHFVNYAIFVFLPLNVGCAIFLIYLAFKVPDYSKYYFVAGSVIYVILALTAMYHTIGRKESDIILPIVYFFFAIILESCIFTYGLGQRVARVYREKIQYEKDLNTTKEELNQRLKLIITEEQQSNALLKERNEKQKLATEVAQLQTKVIRSQMNSHFIFNVLNSIKLFIVENKNDEASLYLGKFSKFIRKILDGSFYEKNTLDKELETVSLYLSIEKMRFNNTFNYQVQVEDNVNTAAHKIPNLLLQPFVENALKHGLMHKKEDKFLWISVHKNSDHSCRVSIKDNGIGRAKSASIPKPKRESHGLHIVQNRIEVFNRIQNTNIHLKINDLEEGTEVVIYL